MNSPAQTQVPTPDTRHLPILSGAQDVRILADLTDGRMVSYEIATSASDAMNLYRNLVRGSGWAETGTTQPGELWFDWVNGSASTFTLRVTFSHGKNLETQVTVWMYETHPR
jgi:hypothetical protein